MERFYRITIVLTLLATIPYSGCTSTQSGPYSPQTEAERNSLRAQQLTQQAVARMDEDPAAAEELLREALGADLFHGPAHNNLGVLYLQRGDLYEAAAEFEWARKLMPGHPDPRLNLGLTLEKAGRVDEALDAYATALEVYANHLPTMQAMARCQLRFGRTDERTAALLEEIALRGQDEKWRTWAQGERLGLREGEGVTR